MKKYCYILLIPLTFSLFSCNEERETELAQREQHLLEKEKAFALKEMEYQQLVKMRDSLQAAKDTPVVQVMSLPDSLVGKWNSRIVCIASDCPEHVIGDQRTDVWELLEGNNVVIAKVINNNNLVRVYTGAYDGNNIKLDYKTDTAAEKQIEMHVLLDDIKSGKIRGARDIISGGVCSARFSIELDRVNN